MSRIRYDNQGGFLGADPGSGGITITFAVAPDFATITGSDYIPISLDPGKSSFEIVWLTAYTASATTGTITRAAEDGTLWPAVAHPNGSWTVAPTVADMGVSSLWSVGAVSGAETVSPSDVASSPDRPGDLDPRPPML